MGIIDTYGGWGAHGGGAFSGKDPTKVDRSAAYICRQMAKSVVKSGLCKPALVQLSYAIGVAKPLSLFVETYGTEQGELSADDITNVIKIASTAVQEPSHSRSLFASPNTRRQRHIVTSAARRTRRTALSSSSGRTRRTCRSFPP